MTFYTRQDIGRLYVIKMILPDDTVVHKIGMTNSNRSTDRMMEILRSWFSKYRFTPYAELRLDMETGYPRQLEAFIHKVLWKHQFIPNMPVEGHTEMFTDIDEQRLFHYLRNFNEQNLCIPAEFTPEEYAALGQLISPRAHD